MHVIFYVFISHEYIYILIIKDLYSPTPWNNKIKKKVIISTKSFFYSKGTEGRELKLVSSLSAFVYLNIVRGSVNKKKKKTELIEIVEFATINLYIEDKK